MDSSIILILIIVLKEKKEKKKELYWTRSTAPAITINDIGLKCFEKGIKEVFGFEYDAPVATGIRNNSDNVKLFEAPTLTFNNNIEGFFKAPIRAATTTLVLSK